MSLIGSLVLGYSVKGLDAVGKSFKTLSGGVSSLASGFAGAAGKIAAFGGALAGLAGIATVGVELGNAFKRIDELGAGADKLGAGVEGLQALQFAATQSDVEIEKLQLALQKMSVIIGQAANGSDSAKSALDRIGESVGSLSAMDSALAFGQIAEKIAAIKNPAQQAAAAVAIFGKSGVELLPLLKQGSAGIGALSAKAKELGLVLSAADVSAIKTANDALDLMKMKFSAIFNVVAARLAPYITALGDQIGGVGAIGEKVAGAVVGALEKAGLGVAYLVDGFYSLRAAIIAIGKVAPAVFDALAEKIDGLSAKNQILGGAVGGSSGSSAVRSGLAARGLGGDGDLTRILGDAIAAFDNEAKGSAVEKYNQMLAQMRVNAAQTGGTIANTIVPAVEQATDAMKEQAEAIKKLQDGWESAGKSLTEKFETPLEKYRRTMKELEDVAAAGEINAETFGRAQVGAFDDLRSSLNPSAEPKFAGAADRGSVEAVSALNRAAGTTRMDPATIIQQAEQQAQAERKRQTAILQAIARNTGAGDEGFNLD